MSAVAQSIAENTSEADRFFIELIACELVFAGKQTKVLFRSEVKNKTLFVAVRTIAHHCLGKIGIYFIPHGSAVTASFVCFHIPVLYCIAGSHSTIAPCVTGVYLDHE